MKNFKEQKLKLLEDINKLVKAIYEDIDWFIASFREKDFKRRAIAQHFSKEKQKELTRLAKEIYGRLK